jgi:hypothetical protein
MSIIQGNAHTSAGGGYQIERSLRFNSADSAYLNRTPASAGNLRTWTWSAWVKRSKLGDSVVRLFNAQDSGSPFLQTSLRFDTDQLRFYNDANSTADVKSSSVYRDASAWYHIVCAIDTTQATAANRVKLYVNGSQVTALATATYPNQNTDMYVNAARAHQIGSSITPSQFFDGYLTEVNFIDGQALTPSSFGETDTNTGVWKPKAYSGTYGTNGFYLKFADNSGTTSTTLGKDSSGNGNNWTPNNFSVTAGVGNDSLVDSPTSYGTDTGVGGEVRGNYATFNPLFRHPSTTWVTTYSEGNLKSSTSNAGSSGAISTIGPTSGKWYCEITCTAVGSATPFVDISTTNSPDQMNTSGEYLPGNYSYGVYYNSAGTRRTNNTATSSWGSTWTTNDVLMLAGDCDTGKVWFGKNGTWQASGNPASGTNQAATLTTATPMWFGCGAVSGAAFVANFGQRAFAYTAPSGFKALCTQNLPTPAIGATSTTQANDYFNPVLYTGNGYPTSGTQSISGVGFQPDFVWIKYRSGTGSHSLYDAIRGATKGLFTNLTNAEETDTNSLTSLNSDGFSVGTNSTGLSNVNVNSGTYVAWNWKANGAGSSNTAGTITSTVSANTTSGFSIVTYTGTGANATVGHGLGVAPSMIIIKRTNSTNSWQVYHSNANASPASGGLFLNTTDAFTALSTTWNSTVPASTVFSIGTAAGTNASGGTYVAYVFAPVAGYSAFGSYTGNAAADGPFIYTGFRPRFVIRKCSSATSNWFINDAARDPSNVVLLRLNADLSDAESSGANSDIDFLSNGFKIRATSTAGVNQSGQTHIYMAFAEVPMKYSLGR